LQEDREMKAKPELDAMSTKGLHFQSSRTTSIPWSTIGVGSPWKHLRKSENEANRAVEGNHERGFIPAAFSGGHLMPGQHLPHGHPENTRRRKAKQNLDISPYLGLPPARSF